MKKWLKNKLGQQRSASTCSVDSDLGLQQRSENGFQIYGLTNYNQNNNNTGSQSHNLLNNLNQVQSANYELKEMNGAARRAINFERFNQEFQQDELLQEKRKSEMYHLPIKKQNLPVDFAGRVLKLEMQIEKGMNFTTTDDVQNLMDLYTQAVEFYNSTQQLDRQKYYENKLHKLMNSPHIKKLYKLHFEKEAKKNEDRKSDGSNNSARKQKTMAEVLKDADKQKKKNLMISAIHQQQRELEQPEVNENTEKQIKKAQLKKQETQKMIKKEFDQNREDIQKRIAERARRRTSSRGKFNQSMMENSQGLVAFSNAMKNQNSDHKGMRPGRVAGSILLPQTNPVDLSNQNYQSTPNNKKKYADRDFQLGRGSNDYVKNLLQQNNSFMKSSGLFDKMKSPMNNAGPKFGQSKLGMSSNTSNYSGSNQSTGGGLASRFQLALSRVIDPTSESSVTGNTATQDDDDIKEIGSLIEEMNQHSDLTVKLTNQAKLCKIFSKTGTSQKNTSLMKRKLEQNLQNLDPEIKKIFNDCRVELETLQQQKEQAVDEFIEQQTENKIVQQRKIERKFKKRMADVDKSIKSLQTENPDQHKEAIQMLNNQKGEVEKEKKKDIEEFVKDQDLQKKKGMQEIKDKYNNLCQKVNIDANVLISALQKKKQQDKEALDKQKANSAENKKEDHVDAPVQVEDVSDKPSDNESPNNEGEQPIPNNNSELNTEKQNEAAQEDTEAVNDKNNENVEQPTATVS